MVMADNARAQSEDAPVTSEKPSRSAQADASTDNTTQPSEKQEQDSQQQNKQNDGNEKEPEEKKGKSPAGGWSDVPLPIRPPGYTLKFTFHKASDLPMSDLNTLSSDPYVLAQLNTDVPSRHKEDPPLRFRTPTRRQNTDPEWNEDWIVANVPASGFKLKLKVFDEDPNDKDDVLGDVEVHVPSLKEGWEGIKNQAYEIKAKGASKRAYGIRMVAVCFRTAKHMRGDLVLSIEMLGRTEEDGQHGHPYTIGPCRWVRHFDPLLGMLAQTREPNPDNTDADKHDTSNQQNQSNGNKKQQNKNKRNVERYNFQANQIQLEGPVPPELYHRYVEFKPWVKRMFTSSGLQGLVLGKALHHQHTRVYNFDKQTIWGHFPQGPCEEMTKQFLELAHWDEGGRIFTYVLTLDALWRFTETGKEFGIDMLSKHTMHSDVSLYIAFSGEFFIRRLKHARRPPPPEPVAETSQDHPPAHDENETHPPKDVPGGPPTEEAPKDPAHYELVIDNDSGTYRPNAKMLPLLKDFMARSLPGLHIQTLDCQADEKRMNRMKGEQRERKKAEGNNVVYTQGSRSSSISSSDEEDLARVQAGMSATSDGQPVSQQKASEIWGQTARDQQLKQKARVRKFKGDYGGKRQHGAETGGDDAEDGETAATP